MQDTLTPFGLPYAAFDVVAIAASLGGLDALGRLLAALPPDFPAAVIVVQHLSPRYPSSLDTILGGRAALPVTWAEQGVRLRRGTIYLAPPDRHVLVAADGTLSLSEEPKEHFTRPAADPLFRTLARHYGKRAIAVVLTGKGRDGAQGARAIKAAGGRVLLQDKLTSTAFDMPRAAFKTGCGDFVLPLPTIAYALVSLVMAPGAADLLRVSRAAAGY